MEKMNAIIFRQTGGIEKLEYVDMEKPHPLRGEALIRVRACALNHLDYWVLTGAVAPKISMPHILGCDVAGDVAAYGPGTRGPRIGSRVLVSPGIRTGHSEYYKSGIWDSLAPGYQIVGFQNNGGFAEYVKVPAANLIPVSDRFSYAEWSAVPLVFTTAWHMLVTHAKLQKNETVLIHAAGSGIGSAAIQIAKYLGAKVITTVGSDAKIKPAKALKADHIINYRKKDFVTETRILTRNLGVDVVFEHIGPETIVKSILCLKRRGRLVHCGVTSGPTAQFDLRYLFANQLTIQGSYMGGFGELKKVVHLMERGTLKPVVDQIFALPQAQDAFKRMVSRENFGKIILTP